MKVVKISSTFQKTGCFSLLIILNSTIASIMLGSQNYPTKDHYPHMQSTRVFIFLRVKVPACSSLPSDTKAKKATWEKLTGSFYIYTTKGTPETVRPFYL